MSLLSPTRHCSGIRIFHIAYTSLLRLIGVWALAQSLVNVRAVWAAHVWEWACTCSHIHTWWKHQRTFRNWTVEGSLITHKHAHSPTCAPVRPSRHLTHVCLPWSVSCSVAGAHGDGPGSLQPGAAAEPGAGAQAAADAQRAGGRAGDEEEVRGSIGGVWGVWNGCGKRWRWGKRCVAALAAARH